MSEFEDALRDDLAVAIGDTVDWCPLCGRRHRIGDLGAPFVCIVGPDGRGPEVTGLDYREEWKP